MKRKEFLTGISIASLGAMLPSKSAENAKKAQSIGMLPPNCTLIPSETAGPFPLDLTTNSFYFRQDVRESQEGVRLDLKMRIIGKSNCLPMANVRLNIWQCSNKGDYSGYNTETGLTYLRGYQMTDANGEANFVTVFPGWYNGRVCHIHFQAFVSSVYAAVSQLTFPHTEKNALYAANPTLYTKGADPKTPATDMIFSDGYAFQLATLTPNPTTGGYDAFLEVTINGSGTTGLAEATPETGGQFVLYQNFPNPYKETTSVPFLLANTSDVQLELWDLSGKKMATIQRENLAAGDHNINLNLKDLGLPTGNYIYQLEVKNTFGAYRQCKMMTAAK
jgi:protocatechuate 3,4-dioxygenase beta subunit